MKRDLLEGGGWVGVEMSRVINKLTPSQDKMHMNIIMCM